jgi:hypothetical protein
MDRWHSTQLESRESTYPRVYTLRRWPKILYSLLGATIVLGGLAIAAWFAANFDYVMKEEVWFVRPLISAVVVLLGAAIIFFTLKYRLIFSASEVEISSPLFGKTIRRDQIAGRRRLTVIVYGMPFPYLFLVQQDERAKKFRILHLFQTDALFEDWVDSLPDLDKRQYEESVKGVLQNPEFGATEAERAERLARAGRIAGYLNVAGAVLAFGAITILLDFITGYYWWLIAALTALPVLAVMIVIASRGLYTIDGQDVRNSARPNLAGLYIVPTIALAFRAWIDISVLDWKRALEIAALAGLAVGLLSLGARTKAKYSAVILLFFSLVWASGVTIFYNTYFDKSVPSVFRTRITGMHKTSGRSTSYYLKLEPWGPRTSAEDVDVARNFYERAAVGNTVCVSLFSGALNVRWFHVGHCRQ